MDGIAVAAAAVRAVIIKKGVCAEGAVVFRAAEFVAVVGASMMLLFSCLWCCCSRCYCRPGVVVLLNIQCSNLGHKDGVKDMIKGN